MSRCKGCQKKLNDSEIYTRIVKLPEGEIRIPEDLCRPCRLAIRDSMAEEDDFDPGILGVVEEDYECD